MTNFVWRWIPAQEYLGSSNLYDVQDKVQVKNERFLRSTVPLTYWPDTRLTGLSFRSYWTRVTSSCLLATVEELVLSSPMNEYLKWGTPVEKGCWICMNAMEVASDGCGYVCDDCAKFYFKELESTPENPPG